MVKHRRLEIDLIGRGGGVGMGGLEQQKQADAQAYISNNKVWKNSKEGELMN